RGRTYPNWRWPPVCGSCFCGRRGRCAPNEGRWRMSSPRNPSYGIYLGDFAGGAPGGEGISSPALPLTRPRIRALEPHERLVVFCSNATRAELGKIGLPGHVDVVRVAPTQSDDFSVVGLVAAAGVDVIHFPDGQSPWRSLAPARVVATIDDDIPPA